MNAARIVRLLIVGALSVTLAVPLLTAQTRTVAAACTISWGGNLTAQKTDSRLFGRTFTATVVYQLGYDVCNLSVPAKIKILSLTEGMSFTGFPASHVHIDDARTVHPRWNNILDYTVAWHSPWDINHQGNSSWSSTWYPNVTLTYYSNVAISAVWRGCSDPSYTCQWVYRFRQGQIELTSPPPN